MEGSTCAADRQISDRRKGRVKREERQQDGQRRQGDEKQSDGGMKAGIDGEVLVEKMMSGKEGARRST